MVALQRKKYEDVGSHNVFTCVLRHRGKQCSGKSELVEAKVSLYKQKLVSRGMTELAEAKSCRGTGKLAKARVSMQRQK